MKGFARFILLFFVVLLGIYLTTRACTTNKEVRTVAHTEFQQDTSLITIPIDIDITSFEPIFNKQMEDPEWFYEEQDVAVNGQVSLSYRVKKEGFAQLYPENDAIVIKVPLYIEILPKIKSSIAGQLTKNTKLKSRILLNANVFVDLKEDWSLETKAETTFEIIESPRLNVAGFEIKFETQLLNSLETGLDEINKVIEDQVSEAIDTKELANLIWTELKTPYPIESEFAQAWATIIPLTIKASDLTPSGPGILQTTFAVKSMIDIAAGKRPLRINVKALPNAQRVKEINEQYSNLNIPLALSMEDLNSLLDKQLKPIKTNLPGNQKVAFSNLQCAIQKNQLIIDAHFENEAAQGQVELITEPHFDAKKQELKLEVLSVSSKSSNSVIDQLVKNYGKSKSGRQFLSNQLSYNLTQDLADLTFVLTNQLKKTNFNEYVGLDGYVDRLEIKNVYLKNNDLLLDTHIKAKAECHVKGQANN